MSKEAFINELRTELATNRLVWEKCPGPDDPPLFLHQYHQLRYELVTQMIDFFEAMTDTEFYKIYVQVKNEQERTTGQIPIWWDKELTEHFT